MKDTKTIETLLEVAEAINFHNASLRVRKNDLNNYRSVGWIGSLERVEHNISVIKRLLLILEKKYNKLLKQLNDEA